MLKNLVMLLRSAELTHASDKFDFTTKGFGADKEIRSQELRQLRGGGQSARSSLNVIDWRHTVEYGSLKLASTVSVVLGNPWFSLGNNYLVFLKREWKTVLWKLLTMFSKKWRRWFISFKRKESTHNYFWPPSQYLGKCAVGKYLTRAPLGYFEPALSYSCHIF